MQRDRALRNVLVEISHDLEEDDVEVMSYLLLWSDKITRKQQEKFKCNSLELFNSLEKQDHLNKKNATILLDVLSLIQKQASTKLKNYFGGKVPGNERLSGYIKSLHEFGNGLGEEEVSKLKYLLNVPANPSEKIKTFWQLFDYALRMGKVENTPDSLLQFIDHREKTHLPRLEGIFNKNFVPVQKNVQTTTDNPQPVEQVNYSYPLNTSAISTIGNPQSTGQMNYSDTMNTSAMSTADYPQPTEHMKYSNTMNASAISTTDNQQPTRQMNYNPMNTSAMASAVYDDSISEPLSNLDIHEKFLPGKNLQENSYSQQSQSLSIDQPPSSLYQRQEPENSNTSRDDIGHTNKMDSHMFSFDHAKSNENEETFTFKVDRLHDKVLTLEDMESCMSEEKIGKGVYGIVYKGKERYKDCDIAIKKLKYKEETYNSLIKEKTVAKLVHPYLLPLFAICLDKSFLYIMYPYMKGGDLGKAIQSPYGENTDLDGIKRIRISYQISQALQFLHQECPSWKKVFNHCDVKLSNILLDQNGNARLSDMGLATEIETTKTYTTWMSHRRDQAGLKTLTEYDVYRLGIVMLELLLNKHQEEFEINDYRQNESSIKSDACKVIWSEEVLDTNIVNMFAKSINDALGTPDDSEQHITSEKLSKDLLKLLKECDDQQFLDGDDSSDKCFACMINKAVPMEPRACSKKTGSGKNEKICQPFCIKCNKISYRNPLHCPKHGACSPPIGYNTFALIVAGNDEVSKENANIFYSGAEAIKRMMISKQPVIMDIKESNVLTSFPQKPGEPCEMKTDVSNKLEQIEKFVEDKKRKGESSRFIFLYTGHGSEKGLNLGTNDVLKTNELEKKISNLSCKMLLILDCCYAGNNTLNLSSKPEDVIQWSSCYNERQSLTKDCIGKGTIFIQCILNILRGELYSDYPVCARKRADDFDNCEHCKEFKLVCKDEKTISFKTLQTYVDKHRVVAKVGNPESRVTAGIAVLHFPLAYYTDKDEDLMFRIDGSKPCKIQNLCPVIDFKNLKSTLLKEIRGQKQIPAEITEDFVQVFVTQRHGRKEIQNLSEISIHREDLDLEVTLREDPSHILNGPVVLFPPGHNPKVTETVLESMQIFKHQDTGIWKKKFNYKTTIDEFKIPLQRVDESSELSRSIKNHFLVIQEKLHQKLNRVKKKDENVFHSVTVEIRDTYILTEVDTEEQVVR